MDIQNVLESIHNYFENMYEFGSYTFENGKITGVRGTYFVGGYVRIIGTVQNDGVFKVKKTENGLEIDGIKAEGEVECYIVRLAIPTAFLNLFEKIVSYQANADKRRGLSSESVGGVYSVSFDTSASSFEDTFKKELNQWRKMPTMHTTDFTGFTAEF